MKTGSKFNHIVSLKFENNFIFKNFRLTLIKNYLNIIIFFISFIFCTSINAQITKKSDFILNLDKLKTDFYVKSLFNKIAQTKNKPIDDISIEFIFNESTNIIKGKNNEIVCNFSIYPTDVKGDTIYKKFSIINELLPSNIIYSVTLHKINSNAIFKKNYETNSFDKKNYLEFSLHFIDSSENLINIENYNINILSRKFIYIDSNIKKLEKRIDLIDNYYKSDSIINSALNILKTINPDSADMLIVYGKQIQQVELIKKKLTDFRFSDNLYIENNDPVNFLKNIDILSTKINSLKNKVEYNFSNLDFSYTQTGINFLKLNKVNEARNYFIKAIQFNPNYIPAQLEIVKLNLKNDNIIAAADSLIKVYNISNNFNDKNRNEAISIAAIINSSIINNGNNLLLKEDFTNAITVFEKGIDFCSLISILECNDNMILGLKKSKTGLYLSYLKVARKALNNDRLEMAGNYLKMAKDYKQNNIIFDNNDDNIILEELINAHTQKGLRFLNFKSYDIAIEHFDIAKNLSSDITSSASENKINQGIIQAKQGVYKEFILKASTKIKQGDLLESEKLIDEALNYQKTNSEFFTTTIGTDTLYANIYQRKYIQLIANGKQLLSYGHHNEALEKLSNAKEFEKIWVFKKDKSLDSLLKIAAKPIILENLSTAQIKAWGNDLLEAENYYKIAYSMQFKYGLNNDKILQEEIEKLNNRIFERNCKNANDLFNKYFSQAIKSINANDFMLTGDYLDMAINVAIDFPQCNIPINLASDKKFEFFPAITYQKIISEANDAYYAGNFKKTVIKYKTATNYFYDFKVNNIGIAHISFSDFMILHDKPEFLLYCINYFSEEKMFEEALSALKILKNKKYNVNETKQLQKKLGLLLGMRDSNNFKNQNYRVILINYTGNERYFTKFRSAYRKGWKKSNSFINIF